MSQYMAAQAGCPGLSPGNHQVLRQPLSRTRCRALDPAPDGYLPPIRSKILGISGAGRAAAPALLRCFVREHVEITLALLRQALSHSARIGECCPKRASHKDTSCPVLRRPYR